MPYYRRPAYRPFSGNRSTNSFGTSAGTATPTLSRPVQAMQPMQPVTFVDQTAPLVPEELQFVVDAAMEIRIKENRKFTELDLVQDPMQMLRVVAEVFVRSYTGDIPYMLDIQRYTNLSDGQLKGALNILMATEERRVRILNERAAKIGLVQTSVQAPAQTTQVDSVTVSPVAPVAPVQPTVPTIPASTFIGDAKVPLFPGYFTVKFDDGSHVTLRLRETYEDTRRQFNLPEGTLDVAYLRGASNMSDSSYTKFGWVKGGVTAILFKSYRNDTTYTRQRNALRVLMGTADQKEFGKAYAQESQKCYICNRDLTTPESLASGIGPICEKNMGF